MQMNNLDSLPKKKILSLTAAVAAVITTTGIVATNNESIAKLGPDLLIAI